MSEQNTRTVVGKVVSDKMDKTRVVMIERMVRHKRYGKYIRRSSKRSVHDEHNQSKTGDRVSITESRPRSKNKTWELVEVIERQT